MRTTNKNWGLNANLKRNAVIQARERMFWRFVAILVCLVAYILLGTLENAKESYDKAQAKPIVIVSNQYVVDNPKESDTATLLRIPEVLALVDNSHVEKTLRKKLMYQNFSNGGAIIARLAEEIRAEADLEKRVLLSTEEAENRASARKIPDLSREETTIHEALNIPSELPQEATAEAKKKEIEEQIKTKWTNLPEDKRHASEDEINHWRATISQMRYSRMVPLEPRELLVLHNVIVEEREDYKTRVRSLKVEIEAIEEDAQLQITAIHEKLKPKLLKLIGAPQDFSKTKLGLFSFDPRLLLDSKNGMHVVYQILRLALIMVPGLGLIFFIVFLIRLVPPISNGTDQFMEKAREFFKGSGAGGPQLAKSLLMTVSAVGIGTAVIVGSTALALTATAADTGDSGFAANQEKRDDKSSREVNGKPGPRGEDGMPVPPETPGPQVDLHQVKLLEPIVYPSPITISGPASVTLSDNSLKTIADAITKFQSNNLNSKISVVEKEIERLKGISPPKPDDCCSTDWGPRIEALEKWQKDSVSTPAPKLDDIANDLRATKEAVEKLRNENLERNQDSGGRGAVTRTKQLFQRDQYLVTTQTVDALRLLMRKPAITCATTTSTAKDTAIMKCCNEKPTKTTYCPL